MQRGKRAAGAARRASMGRFRLKHLQVFSASKSLPPPRCDTTGHHVLLQGRAPPLGVQPLPHPGRGSIGSFPLDDSLPEGYSVCSALESLKNKHGETRGEANDAVEQMHIGLLALPQLAPAVSHSLII